MIKNGLSGKEMAFLWRLPFNPIESHRKNIRHKLGLSARKPIWRHFCSRGDPIRDIECLKYN